MEMEVEWQTRTRSLLEMNSKVLQVEGRGSVARWDGWVEGGLGRRYRFRDRRFWGAMRKSCLEGM